MNTTEITTLKALEICHTFTGCDGCPYIDINDCGEFLLTDAFKLIQKYKEENERLLQTLDRANECIDEIEDALRRGVNNDRAMEAIEKYNGFCPTETKENP